MSGLLDCLMENTDPTLLRMVRDRLATMFVPERLAFMHRLVAGYCLECGVVEVPGKPCLCEGSQIPDKRP